jgi:hypothetical protein
LKLLGDRDPVEVQRELPDWLSDFIDPIEAGVVDVPEAPGKWSIGATIRHLAHTESVYAYRYRVVFAESDPVIPGFDQDAWDDRLKDDPIAVRDAVDHLIRTRHWNLLLLARLTPEDLSRTGLHAERGVESLDQLVKLGAAHDLVHRRQLERIRDTVAVLSDS